MNVVVKLLVTVAFVLSPLPSFSADATDLKRPSGTLECRGETKFQRFHATLDFGSWDADSPYFTVRGATINHHFRWAPLHCIGHELGSIRCVGYWNQLDAELFEVQFEDSTSGPKASLIRLRGDFPVEPLQWPCSVTL